MEPLPAPAFCATPDPPGGGELLGPLLVRGERTLLLGGPGVGKSRLALRWGAAVAAGRSFGTFSAAGGARVLLLDLEQHPRVLRARLRAEGLHRPGAGDPFCILSIPAGLELDRDPAQRQQLCDVLAEVRPELLIIDPLYRLHAGDSREEAVLAAALQPLDEARAEHDMAVLLVCHPRKALNGHARQQLVLDDAAGSGLLGRAVEVALALERVGHEARLRLLKDRNGRLSDSMRESLLVDFLADGRCQRDLAAAAEGRDLAAELEQLFADGQWRVTKDLALRLRVRQETVRATLRSHPDRFHRLGDGRLVGRSKSAEPWGTVAMFRRLDRPDEEVVPPQGPPGTTGITSSFLGGPAGRWPGCPPYGGDLPGGQPGAPAPALASAGPPPVGAAAARPDHDPPPNPPAARPPGDAQEGARVVAALVGQRDSGRARSGELELLGDAITRLSVGSSENPVPSRAGSAADAASARRSAEQAAAALARAATLAAPLDQAFAERLLDAAARVDQVGRVIAGREGDGG